VTGKEDRMLLTIYLAIVFCAAMALMLLSCVAFIQDNRFFSSAPKEAREVLVQRDQELFYGARTIGWTLFILSALMILGAGVISIWDGFRSGFTFRQFFLRFVVMLLGLKAFDIGFFDWFLLCNAGLNFFPRFYPETKAVLGHHLFGYNWKTHLAHIIATFPVSVLLAWICSLFSGQ
jgi:hypothetical protein